MIKTIHIENKYVEELINASKLDNRSFSSFMVKGAIEYAKKINKEHGEI